MLTEADLLTAIRWRLDGVSGEAIEIGRQAAFDLVGRGTLDRMRVCMSLTMSSLETLILVSGYNVQMRAKTIDRMSQDVVVMERVKATVPRASGGVALIMLTYPEGEAR